MKNYFICFWCLICLNLSCLKDPVTITTIKKVFINQTQRDLTITIANEDSTRTLSINLLKNSKDSFDMVFYDYHSIDVSKPVYALKYKNITYEIRETYFDFTYFNINFNINKNIKFCTSKYLFLCFFRKNPELFFNYSNEYNKNISPVYNIGSFVFSNNRSLYLLPSLYDSAR
ncbi:MAG: hypothetical protein QM539_08205 [Alphaproteobacteria bacterium]|nr:hypothetical protein [Alphaproteobacteria bacterium]